MTKTTRTKAARTAMAAAESRLSALQDQRKTEAVQPQAVRK